LTFSNRYLKLGDIAIVHYRKSVQNEMQYHGKRAFVYFVAKGKGPKNVLVIIDNVKVVIPRGNLR
jgi:hypothetical protein